jgi:hypothetical protein
MTPDAGSGNEKDQQFWRRLPSDFSQVVLSGGHDIYLDDPKGALE